MNLAEKMTLFNQPQPVQMPKLRWLNTIGLSIILLCLPTAVGCGSTTGWSAQQPNISRPHRTPKNPAKNNQTPKPPEHVPSNPQGPNDSKPAVTAQEILEHLPDPIEEIEQVNQKLANFPRELKKIDRELADIERKLSRQQESPERDNDELELGVKQYQLQKEREDIITRQWAYPRLLNQLNTIRRNRIVRLGLNETISRALMNNYQIQMHAYSPAIAAASIVQAEAQFDAIFFANFSNDKQDRPSSSQLIGTQSEVRSFEAGVTKLLSTGANVTASYSLTRTKTNLVFQTLNPSYFNNFIVDFRQPFLQGFGIDFTRSEIEKNKLERDNTIQLISREIQDIIYDTEVAYWQLMAARRAFTISARLIAWLEWIDYIAQERKYDIVQAGLSSIKAIIKARRAQFVELSSELRNAEDNLKSKINDPDLNLSQDIEIIPTEPFAVVPLILDQVGEVSDALMNNPELRSAKLEIEKAKIDVGVAKNQALPRLDAVFRYIIDGLGGNADRAFSQLSESDFQEYFISVEFEWPIGNRGPEAVLRAARLTLAQAIAKHRASIENLINSVYQVIRLLQSNFEQVKLQRDATYYAKTRRYHTRTRTYLYGSVTDLEFMLSTHTGLADIRSELLNTITNYQISLINLERTKGTLLRYNNISLRGADDQYYQKPYRPIGP